MTLAGIAGALLVWGLPVAAVSTPRSPEADAFWTADERPARLRVVSPTAQRRTGQGIFLIASVDLEQSCEYPGPIFEVRDRPAGSPRTFRARVWHEHGVACEPAFRQATQPLHIPTDSPGPMRFESGGRTFEVEVSGKPGQGRFDENAGARPCRFDDDCWATDVCVPRRNDRRGLGICAEICGSGRDCPGAYCDLGPGIVGICGLQGRAGLGPRTELSAATRHDCRNDQDCDLGLKCFKRAADPAARGRCEMLCSSAHMVCTGAHQCSAEGICEWLGE